MIKRNSLLYRVIAGCCFVWLGCQYVDEKASTPPATPVAPAESGSSGTVSTAGGETSFINLSGVENVSEKLQEGFTQTESGLQYRVLREGEGAKPTASNSVTVHYKGQLLDGTEFDSSYKRGEPATFGLSQVVAGWTEGLQLVNEGGMIELIIPPDLGYGPGGMGPIPPNATLQFIVELQKIN